MRFGLEIVDLSEHLAASEFRVFAEALSSGGKVAGILAPACADYSRAMMDHLQEIAVAAGAKGLAWLKIDDEISSPIAKFLTDAEKSSIVEALGASAGDLVLILAGQGIQKPLGQLRLAIASQQSLAPKHWRFAWVTDFPLFELDEEGHLASAHHPFTSPNRSHLDRLETDPLHISSNAYDLVLNGVELGSGSIRIHSRDLQERVFRLLGISEEEAELRFGWFLRALEYGAPPHAGIALGMDRLAMMMAGEESLRDVIAFPKTANGMCPLTEAPMPAGPRQLEELGIRTTDT